jgi:hypothetical protein
MTVSQNADQSQKPSTNQSIIVWSLKTKPFMLSLAKHERLGDVPFDKHLLGEPFALRQAFD